MQEKLETQDLRFLWLELTSRCNLHCIHCYAESGPSPDIEDILTPNDYHGIIDSAASLGCKQVQFIGGEPTLVTELPAYIAHAHECGYEFVEVFTNATRISDQLLECFVRYRVAVATSFYSCHEATHDRITKHHGSYAKTVQTIRRLLAAGLDVRAGIIVMDENRMDVEETQQFLQNMGIHNINTDRIRAVGRALSSDKDPAMSELCGKCWLGSICVAPDGAVSPCIMSRAWSIGSLKEHRLEDLVHSPALHTLREQIFNDVWSSDMGAPCSPQCSPHCQPTCPPNCSPTCSPISCGPRGCWPAFS